MTHPLEKALGLSFRDGGLLRLALVHGSALNESPGQFDESNQRLEFLGDAVLGLVVAEELYRRHADWPEGRLTAARAAIVGGGALAGVGESLGLGEHQVMGRGEEASGGRRRPSNLAETFEAILGALLLDQGYEAARGFVLRLLASELAAAARGGGPSSPKSALQEMVQARGSSAPTYRILAEEGRGHDRLFTAEVLVDGEVAGRGAGPRKSLAEQEAARQALSALGHDM